MLHLHVSPLGALIGFNINCIGVSRMETLFTLNFIRPRNFSVQRLPIEVLAVVVPAGVHIRDVFIRFYCEVFGAVRPCPVALNPGPSKAKHFGILVFLIVTVFFSGAASRVYAGEPLKPTFGKGSIHLRIYSDYFCHSCSKLAPQIENSVASLVKKGRATVTFVDVPFQQLTALYARYFLYALNEKHDVDYAIQTRRALFAAASQNISSREAIEAHLKKSGIRFKVYDPSPTFDVLRGYLQEDQIRQTPLLVVIEGGRKRVVRGPSDIEKAIRDII